MNEELLHCFRCGARDVEVNDLGGDKVKCPDCGERSLMTTVEALDLLNDLYLKGNFSITKRRKVDDT